MFQVKVLWFLMFFKTVQKNFSKIIEEGGSFGKFDIFEKFFCTVLKNIKNHKTFT